MGKATGYKTVIQNLIKMDKNGKKLNNLRTMINSLTFM